MGEYNIDFSAYFWAILSLLATTFLFLTYHFFSESSLFRLLIKRKWEKEQLSTVFIIIRRSLGFFLFGLIPIIIIVGFQGKDLSFYGLSFDNMSYSLLWIAGLTPVILLMNYFNAPKADNLAIYPQIRKKLWTKSLLATSAASWIAYLTGYEFMFRGFLLFSCYYAMDAPSAIAINVCIYSLVHLPKGIKETIGAIPLGLLLSYLTLQSNSIMIALAIHIIMALSNEWFSVRANPEIRLKK